MNAFRYITVLSMLLCLTPLIGCFAKSQPAQYYTLSSMQRTESAPRIQSRFTVSVGPVIVPDSLKRPQIAIRTNDNQVSFSEFHKWAGLLKDDIKRILAENISILLSEEGDIPDPTNPQQVVTHLNRGIVTEKQLVEFWFSS